MVASAAAWDLTGSRSQLPSGQRTGETTSTGGGATTVNESSTQSQFVNKQNTPQFALDALEQLLSQLSDRPVLSDQEAAAQFPLAVRIFDRRAGWGYDMGGGRIVFGPQAEAHAQRWNQQQLAKRQQAQQASGTIRGGTAATSEAGAARTDVRQRLQKGMQEYSKEAAFEDASALAARFQRQLLEQVMPQISQAIESSGTSGGAVGGLLAQDAASRVAEAQAALGLQTSAQYGQISNQMAALLAELASALPPELQALIQTLGISKGTIDQGVTIGSSSSTKSVQQQETKQAESTEQQSGLPALLGNLRITPQSVQAPVTAPQIIGSSPSLNETLTRIARQDTYGGGYQF